VPEAGQDIQETDPFANRFGVHGRHPGLTDAARGPEDLSQPVRGEVGDLPRDTRHCAGSIRLGICRRVARVVDTRPGHRIGPLIDIIDIENGFSFPLETTARKRPASTCSPS
jgi:hypothetical protein